MQSFQLNPEELNKYPLFLSILNFEHHNEPVDRPHGIGANQIAYVLRGSGEVIVSGQRSIVHQGDIFIIRHNVGHIHRALGAHGWVLDIIGINGKMAKSLLDFLHLYSGAYSCDDPDTFLSYVSQLLDTLTIKHRPQQLLDRSMILYNFVSEIAASINLQRAEQVSSSRSLTSFISSYIEEHFREDISLTDIAHAADRTPEYICAAFKQDLGQSIITYLNNFRISQARLLLEHFPNKSIAEIGSYCGFNSPSYFDKIFKKVCTVTPQQFRLSRIISE